MIDISKTFEMEKSVASADGKVSTSNATVPPTKNGRKVYSILLDNQDSNSAQLTLTIELGGVVQRTFPFSLPAYGEKDVNRNLNAPIFTITPANDVKVEVTSGTGPVFCLLSAYDLE